MPIVYVHHYLDKVRNLNAFLDDYPSVSRGAFAAIEEQMPEKIDSVINSEREYVSCKPWFNETRMTVVAMFDHLAFGEDTEMFSSQCDASGTQEQVADLVRVAKSLVEFYAYKIVPD